MLFFAVLYFFIYINIYTHIRGTNIVVVHGYNNCHLKSQTQTSSEIVRTMLRMSEVTTSPTATCTKPLSANEIFRSLPPSYNIARPIVDQYLTLLVDDPVRPLQGTAQILQSSFRSARLVLITLSFSDFLDGVCGKGWGKWRRDVRCQYPSF